MTRLTVFLGRFSPFHNGHVEVLNRALASSQAVLVLIGSSGQARTTKNPFSFEERREMILAAVRALKSNTCTIIIKPIYDHLYNDQDWIRGVQDAVDETKAELSGFTEFNGRGEITTYLTGCDRDASTWYLRTFGNFFIQDLVPEAVPSMRYSATRVREILFSEWLDSGVLRHMVPPSTLDFLRRFNLTAEFENLQKEFNYLEHYKQSWHDAPYPPTFLTVDACVVQSGHVLLNVRENFPGKGLWCLPGGFLEQNERLIDGSVRELIEETKIELSRAQLYGSIKARETFDHPERSLRGRTVTTCFLYKLDDSKPLPRVRPQRGEVQKVLWTPINEALNHPENFFEDHYYMLSWGISRAQI